MRLSYVIISYNRKETLLKTLATLPTVTPLPPTLWETWVVDNASTDGSADAVAEKYPRVNLIRNPQNQGMCARNHAFERCTGQYIISIDDDSHPMDHRSVATALSRMDRDPSIAVVVAKVVLPNGSTEAPALPSVFMGGASCFRKSVLDQVGGFNADFFRQAEEYDLSFRIWAAGHRIERCEQVIFRHEKVAGVGRDIGLVHRLDMRNNLIIAQRYLPAKMRRAYWDDWKLRYGALAEHQGYGKEAAQGLWSARRRRWREMLGRRDTLPADAIENIFGLRAQARMVGDWARENSVWRVVIADFGKNLYATYNACRSTGLQIRCIADSNPAFDGLEYRGLPIAPVSRVFEGGGIEGVVVANINPAQVDARVQAIRRHFQGPVLRLWNPRDSLQAPQASAA